MVPDSYIAWHAGKSKWKKHNFLNQIIYRNRVGQSWS